MNRSFPSVPPPHPSSPPPSIERRASRRPPPGENVERPILITGICGRLGRRLARRLHRELPVIGIDLGEQLVALKTQLRATKIGEAGYYYIVNAAPGPEFGRLILHPYKEDQKIDTLVDRHGNSLVALMGARASGEITYWWKNVEAGEADEREKLVIFETMTTPHWVIAGVVSAAR